MNILALETSTDALSIAVGKGGDIIERHELAPRQHTQLIMGRIESLLDEAGLSITQLDRLAFGRGPGSFTGVRIANSIIQGLAIARDIPVAAISSLAALAALGFEQHSEAQQALVVNDARMKELFWAHYQRSDDGVPMPIGEELLTKADSFSLLELTQWIELGSAWSIYGDAWLQAQASAPKSIARLQDCSPHARHVLQIAETLSDAQCAVAEDSLPNYLRESVADPRARVNQ